jgi:hypothetical protein
MWVGTDSHGHHTIETIVQESEVHEEKIPQEF